MNNCNPKGITIIDMIINMHIATHAHLHETGITNIVKMMFYYDLASYNHIGPTSQLLS